MIARLLYHISQVCPVFGIAVPQIGNSATVRIDYAPSATAPQQAAAQAVLAAFDWSQAAEDTWIAQLAKVQAQDAIDYGAMKRGTRDERLIRALALAVLDRFNTTALKYNALLDAIDAAASLAALKTAVAAIADIPQLTPAQLVDAIKVKIAETGE